MRFAFALVCASILAVAAARPAATGQPKCWPGVLHRVGTSTVAFSAVVNGRTRAYRRPRGLLLATFGRLNDLKYPTTLSIVGAILDGRCDPTWYRVKLPMRPNGVVGYIRPRDVTVGRVTTRIAVDLSRRELSFYRRGRLVMKTPVAVGAPSTPTPIGRYFVSERIRVDEPDGPYGPVVLGISAFSDVLQGWAKGGPIAIHGTDQPWSIGRAASHGCVRVPNATLRRLFAATAAGTPVVIHP